MSASQKAIPFRLARISTEEFATFKEHLTSQEEQFQFGLNVQIKANSQEHLVGVFTRFQFEQKGKPVLILEIACHFQIENNFWNENKEDKVLMLPKAFATHLLVLTVGTARGIIHTKKPDWLPFLLLPTLDVSTIFSEDVELDLGEAS